VTPYDAPLLGRGDLALPPAGGAMTPKAAYLLDRLGELDPALAALVRLGGGPSSGLALRFRVDEGDGVAVLELVRPRRFDIAADRWVSVPPWELLAWIADVPALAHLVAARDDTVDDHVARTTAVDVARALRLPLAELYDAGPRRHITPDGVF